ncbi:MAG: glycosyltransferase family 4 protein [Chloroflexota bacterium]|nr:glycosyltransferase family 4 protein [Chloroflexota bacterium]
MRVVHIIKATKIAGAEGHLLTLLPGLAATGVDVRLILLHPPGNTVDDFVDALQSGMPPVPVERMLIRRHLDLALIGLLRRRLRELQPDIVHTHLIHADVYGIPAARLAGVRRIIASRHADDPFRRWLPMRAIHALLWRLATDGIPISDAVRRFCAEIEFAPPRKLHTIHYGIVPPAIPADRDASGVALRRELGVPPHAPLIGFVGRLIWQKGVIYGLQAFARALLQFPTAQLVIVGDGKLRAMLERKARQYGIARSVHFLGWRTDVPRLMAAFDVFLLPTLQEGFGLVLLEAMAGRTPILSTTVSAIPEIVIDGETGLLAPPRDPAAMGDALIALLGDEALRRHMGLMGEDRLETTFSADTMIAATAALYRGNI